MSAVYTYSEARQNLATVLEKAAQEGEVRIKRRDGRVFVIKPEVRLQSPLDVPAISLDMSREEIVQFVRESRRTYTEEQDP